MGAFFSLNSANRKRVSPEILQNGPNKRRKLSPNDDEANPRLIPSLPDELSTQILARLPRSFYLNLRLVSQKWKATLTSPELFQLRKELGTSEEWLYLLIKAADDKMTWHALDPVSRMWQKLPLMPHESRSGLSRWNVVGPSVRIAEVFRTLLGRKDSSDQMPFHGCAISVVHGCIYVLGGFSKSSTMKCVWRFDTIRNSWTEMPSMSTGRAYCKTGILNNKIYVIGGVNRGRGSLTPLQSAEVFDPCTGTWSDIPNMPFAKVHALPNGFLADLLKPMATGMTSHKGKLFVPQSLYSWPFVVDVGGEIYDPETNVWDEMPTGMGEGWPARQAGTKLSVVVDNELYAFDPSASLDSGNIKVYDEKEDTWKVVIGKVPIYDSVDSESPYLLASFHGKLHVITKDANHHVAVLQADSLRDVGSSLSSCSTSSKPPLENAESQEESESFVWKMVADRDFGSAELVSCQVVGM